MPETDLTEIELSSVCVRSNDQDSNSQSNLPEEVSTFIILIIFL